MVDDEIETNGHEGTVEAVSGRTTVLRTTDGDESEAQDGVLRNVRKRLDDADIAMPSLERIVRRPDLPARETGSPEPKDSTSS